MMRLLVGVTLPISKLECLSVRNNIGTCMHPIGNEEQAGTLINLQ